MPALLLIVPSQVSRSQQGQSGPKVRLGANLILGVAEEFIIRVDAKVQVRFHGLGQEVMSKPGVQEQA